MCAVNEEFLYEGLVREFAEKLPAAGAVTVPEASLRVSTQQWRRAARAGAASIGRKAKTTQLGASLHAWLPDWPATDEEREAAEKKEMEVARLMRSAFPPRTVRLIDAE
jgi:hypothetical protein